MSAPKRRETDGKEHQFPRPFCPSMPALLHLSLLTALRSPPVPSAVRRAPAPLLCDGDGEWSSREDWALTDLAASFTVGEGEHKATFWEALASSTFELHGRSHSECAARMEELSPGKYGSQPRRLDVWQRLPDGRYMGVEDGRKVKVSVSEEGRLTKGSRPMYIELTCGRIYELVAGGDLSADVSVPPPVSELAPVREPAKTRPSGQLVAIAALALVALGEKLCTRQLVRPRLGPDADIGPRLCCRCAPQSIQTRSVEPTELAPHPASGPSCRGLADLGSDPTLGRCKPRSWTR